MKSESLKQLESINTEYDVDKIEAYIDYLENKVDNLEGEKESLKNDITILEDEVESKEHCFEYPAGYNRNIVSDLVLEKLFENLNLIPLDSIERLTKEYTS